MNFVFSALCNNLEAVTFPFLLPCFFLENTLKRKWWIARSVFNWGEKRTNRPEPEWTFPGFSQVLDTNCKLKWTCTNTTQSWVSMFALLDDWSCQEWCLRYTFVHVPSFSAWNGDYTVTVRWVNMPAEEYNRQVHFTAFVCVVSNIPLMLYDLSVKFNQHFSGGGIWVDKSQTADESRYVV